MGYFREKTDWCITWGQAHQIPAESDVVLIDARTFVEIKMHDDSMLANKALVVHGNVRQLEASFMLGCNDYIKLPWSIEEAHCRIARFNKEQFSFTTTDGIAVSLHANYLVYGADRISITPTESRILEILIKHKNSVVVSHAMHHAITTRADSIRSNEIRVHIYNIRKKLEALPSVRTGKDIITTIPQKGYLLQGI